MQIPHASQIPLIISRSSIVGAVIVFAVTQAALTVVAGAQEVVQLVLLAGQFNMDGSVSISALPPEFKQAPANIKLIDIGEPVRFAVGKTFGPEVAFAASLAAARPSDNFHLVKQAIGGTSLAGWAPQWDESRLASDYDTTAGPIHKKLLEDHASAI